MQRENDKYPYGLLSPSLIITLFIVFIPLVYTFGLSFFHYVLWDPDKTGFIFLGNYSKALTDEVFWISFRNTIWWIVGVIGLQLLLGFATALFLNQDFCWRGLARSLILLPWVAPSVVTALMWRWMYDGNHGVINDLLVRLGILEEFFPWLARGETALLAIMIALMWQGFPFFAVMILAGLQAIPRELYEVADVDGANVFQKFFRITLPMITPILLTTILLRTIWVANSLDIIFIMTGGGPGYSSYTLPLFSYLRAYKALDFGYASTIAVLLTILLMGIVAGYVIRILKTEERLR